MEEDKGFDLLGIKPVAKALEKVTDKTMDGLGSFFGAICMPAAEEFGLLLRDKIATFRKKNLVAIAEKSKEKIREQKIRVSGQSNPVLIREVLEEASWSDDNEIQSMWAGLLSIASGNNAISDDSLIYTDILKRLTPFQARLINAIYFDPRCCSVKPPISTHVNGTFYPDNKLIYSVRDVLELYPGDLSEIVPIANTTHDNLLNSVRDHFIAISRFRPQIEALISLGLIHDVKFLNNSKDGISVYPNLKGLDFFMRCLGYSVYPLEAFILTLQHWNNEKGIDPFKYNKP